MPATVTLATTTLTYGIDAWANQLTLASGSGVYPGYRLWIDRELIEVQTLPDSNNVVNVIRGKDGTAGAPHSSSALVTIGTPDQFYTHDPLGAPPTSIRVSPYINALNGKVWLAQGDPLPEGGTLRWWQEVTYTYPLASLGVTQAPLASPTSST